MRTFNYSTIREQKWDSDVLGLIAAIYKEAGKQAKNIRVPLLFLDCGVIEGSHSLTSIRFPLNNNIK